VQPLISSETRREAEIHLTTNDVSATLGTLLKARQALALIERQFLIQLVSLLAGKQIERQLGESRRGLKRERLKCPRCGRRFSLPMHLGRHLAAVHKQKARRVA
jgi:uncharacterized C2H2 Zn-finger protein